MAGEVKIAREGGVMGLRFRNAVGGRADRAHGRPTWPSLNGRNDTSDLRRTLQGRTYDELIDAIKAMSSASRKVEGLNELIKVYSEVAEQKRRK